MELRISGVCYMLSILIFIFPISAISGVVEILSKIIIYIPILIIGLIQAYFTVSFIYKAGICCKSIKPTLLNTGSRLANVELDPPIGIH